ncbi:MAG: M23 family metallopeptidase [Bdellovibrionaceae bacterium]|nr:M23 family metallopeptidase [Pseudobdellovibrionaceae bacterium]
MSTATQTKEMLGPSSNTSLPEELSHSNSIHESTVLTSDWNDEEEGIFIPSSVQNLKEAPFALTPGRLNVFDWPVDEARLTRGYYLKDPRGRRNRKPHLGLDLANRRGTPVYASHNGRVIYVGSTFRGYGRMVLLEGPTEDYATLYAHLSKVRVKEGMMLKQGDWIGDIGNTGRSTGPHLHFEIRTLAGPVDPLLYLPPIQQHESSRFGRHFSTKLTSPPATENINSDIN